VFREESGAVGLSGRDLPAAQALAGHANVVARARQYEASGAFPRQTTGSLQALAYLHLLNGVTARDAIAFARAATAEPPDGGQDDGGHDDDGHDEDVNNEDSRGEADSPAEALGGSGSRSDDQGPDDDDEDPGDGEDPAGGEGPGNGDDGPGSGGSHSALPEVTVPLATLQRLAERPGDNRLLGPLDPAMARDLAAAAARSPPMHAGKSPSWTITATPSATASRGPDAADSKADHTSRSYRPRPPARCPHIPVASSSNRASSARAWASRAPVKNIAAAKPGSR
jgi:hypothetical protein